MTAIFWLLATTLAAPQSATAVRQPAGKWNLDYGADACVLWRKFGAGTDEMTLVVKAVPTFSTVDLSLIEPGRRANNARTARILPAGHAPIVAEATSSIANGSRVTRMIVQRPELAAIAGARQLSIERGSEAVTVAPASFVEALTATGTCEDALLAKWGIDPDVHARAVTKPVPKSDAGRWITYADYPSQALRQNEQGEVLFRLDVNAEGNPSSCDVLVSSGHPLLDGTVCALLKKRARFSPARTSSGEAIPYAWVNRFRWYIGQ